ncbi:MAG: hypothetical protein ACQ9MH_05015 [Nitrospinales bacterium]
MNSDNRIKNEKKFLCEEINPDDGVDPRKYFSKVSKSYSNRKAFQLCKEIKLTLNLTFAGELVDPYLQNLSVHDMKPIPNSADLLVILIWIGDWDYFDETEILSAVKKVYGYLRSEVARSINRKRVPAFSIRLLNPQEVKL